MWRPAFEHAREVMREFQRLADYLGAPRIPTAAPREPQDGMMYLDEATNRLYVRVNGVWRYTTLT